MTYENFTQIAQKALKEGTQIAKEINNEFIENGHILKGIMNTDKNVTPFILRKINIDFAEFETKVNLIISGYSFLREGGKLNVSGNVERSLNKALEISKQLGDDYISIEHILAGILLTGDSVATLMKEKGINSAKLSEAIKELRKGSITEKPISQEFETLKKFAINLNERVKTGKFDPVIGRTEEIRRILQILSRKAKNNPIILGEPGVGKTSVVEGLAQRIERGDVPENLKGNMIYSLDIGSLIAGASKQGEFEERLKSVIKEVQESNGEIILFIDEIHLLVGAGKGAGAMDAANILKPALARGELKVIGATTLDEYQKYIEKDKALERRFQKVIIGEPSTEDAISILRGIKEKYENHHRVKILDEAIIGAVELSKRYVTDRYLPDKAIDLLDEAASKLRLELNSMPAELDELERRITQIQIEKEAIKAEGDEKKLKEMQDKIAEYSDERSKYRAVWETQKTIIAEIHKCRENLANLRKEEEQAEKDSNFEKAAELKYQKIKEAQALLYKWNSDLANNQSDVILSKEAVDKQLIAEIVSQTTGIPLEKMSQTEKDKLIHLEDELNKRVIGQRDAIVAISEAVRRNKAGLQDENRPIGSFIFLGTTGVGKTELAKTLAQFLFDDDKAMIRIDMSEYMEQHSVSKLIGAPPGYVGYDEGGQLTDAVRFKPYSVVLLDEIEKAHKDVFNLLLQVLDEGILTDSKGRSINFKNTIIILTSNAGADKIAENFAKITSENRLVVIQRAKEEVSKVLREKMSPEFLNRLDEIIMFTPLTYGEIVKIVELQLNNLKKKLVKNDISIDFTRIAVQWIARMSYNPQYGARPVKRTIQRYILNELSKQKLLGTVCVEKIILIDFKEGGLTFTNVTKEELDRIKLDEEKQIASQKDQITKMEQEAKQVDKFPEKIGFLKKIINWFKGIFSKKMK